MTIGLRQLAEHLELSVSTVSRALNGASDVSEATQKRVLEAASQLGYVANQSGRSLRSGATGVVGFMLQTGPAFSGEGESFFMSVFDGVQTVLCRHSLDLVVLPCSSAQDPDEYLKRVVSRGAVDGIIISGTRRRDRRIDFLTERRIPFVSFGRSLIDTGQPWIDLDFEGMAKWTVDRFAKRGHQRIGMFQPSADLNFGHLFFEEYRRSLERHGIPYSSDDIYSGPTDERGGFEIAKRILTQSDRPSAFAIPHQMVTIGFYRGLLEAGLVPGLDIDVIGQNGVHTRYLSPSLTGFSISVLDLGIMLAEALLAAMPAFAANYPLGVVRQIFPTPLVEGESDAGRRRRD